MKHYILFLSLFFSFALSAQDSTKREHVVHDVKAKHIGAARGSSPDFTEVPSKDSALAETECTCGCDIIFDNYTGYWINVYVDSVFKGVIEPWGQGTLWVNPESKTWYAETTGGTYYWEGIQNCSDQWWINFRQ